MKPYAIFLSLVGILMLVISPVAQASLVTGNFDSTPLGTLKVTHIAFPVPGISLGDPVHLTVSYDNSQPDINPKPERGEYQFTAAPSGMSISINALVFSHSHDLMAQDFTIEVYNDSAHSSWGDQDDLVVFRGVTARAGDYIGNPFIVEFAGAGQNNILNNDSLPTLEQLEAFPYIEGVFVAGEIPIYTSFGTPEPPRPPRPPGPPPGSGIPLPPSLLLLGSGLLGLAGWRKLRKG